MLTKRLVSIFCIFLFVGCATHTSRSDYSGGRLSLKTYKDNSCTISLSGNITPDLLPKFKVLVSELKANSCVTKNLRLQSSGGSIDVAIEIGRIVRSEKITTIQGNSERCDSACTIIFIGGEERLIMANPGTTKMGFHQIKDAEGFCLTIEQMQKRPNYQYTYQPLNQYANEMLPPNAANLFLQSSFATDCQDMTYINPAKYLDIGLVTVFDRGIYGSTLRYSGPREGAVTSPPKTT